MRGFVFGGDTGLSYEQLQRRKQMADAMRGGLTRTPRNVGEGLSSLGQALMVRGMDRKIDKAEAEGRAASDEVWSNIFGGGYAQSAIPSATPTENPDQGDPRRGTFPTDSQTSSEWEAIRQGIFAGESGGDYDALFGFSNRPGKQFADTKLTDMTVDQALAFADPSGPYGQWVKGKVGRVATPMGAYQVVGTTLKGAKDGLGLTGNERMSPELQERIGRWIYETQGTGAWEGYKGPQSGGTGGPTFAALTAAMSDPYIRRDPGKMAVVNALLQQQMQANDPLRRLQIENERVKLAQAKNPQMDPKDRYKVVDGQLWDLWAEGSPAPVQTEGQPAPVDFDSENKLRKEFTGLPAVKAFSEQSQAFGRIVASAKDPSPAGDLALIFNYMKVLDPGSVVRESEFATAEQAAAWMQRMSEDGYTVPRPIAAAVRKAQTGQRLSPEQRSDFVGRASELYRQAESQNNDLHQDWKVRAEEYGMSPERTLPDFRYRPKGATPFSARPQAREGSTKQEVSALTAAQWTGPTAAEVRRMDPQTVNAMMSAYDLSQIPDDVLLAIQERVR